MRKRWPGIFGLAVLIVAALFRAGAAAAANESFITTPGAAKIGIDKIQDEAGRALRPLSIEISAGRIGITAQGSAKSWHLEEWQIEALKLWVFAPKIVSRPQPAQASGPVDDVESGFFDLAGVALDKVSAVADAAMARAALEDAAQVTSIRIGRRMSIMPKPSYADIVWTIEVASPYESATIYANAKGEITGSDLSQTRRARELDLLTGDWPADQAQSDLAAVLGPRPVVHEIRLYDSYVFIEAEHPTDPSQATSYSWDLSGVRRSIVDTPNIFQLSGISARQPFAFPEADLTVLPALREEAKKRLEIPGGTVTSMTAEKATSGLGEPVLLWEVEVSGPDKSKGTVVADVRGGIVKVNLPPGRVTGATWPRPEAVREALDRIAKGFGPGAKFVEIIIDDRTPRIVAEDPRAPGETAEFHAGPEGIERWGQPFDTMLRDEQAFTLEEAAGIDVSRIGAMMDETVRRMNLPDGGISRVTISRGNDFVQSQRNQITVEVRMESKRGDRGGRLTFEPDGKVIDVVTP